MKQLILVRGLPGAGKTTLATAIVQYWQEKGVDAVALATDDYFEDSEGRYVFDPMQLPGNHTKCFEDAVVFLERGYVVAVHNTFTTMKEMERYVRYAALAKIPISVIDVRGPWASEHGVPQDTIDRMKGRWENFP